MVHWKNHRASCLRVFHILNVPEWNPTGNKFYQRRGTLGLACERAVDGLRGVGGSYPVFTHGFPLLISPT